MANKVITGRRLTKTAIKDFWHHKGTVIGALSLVAVPLTILNLVPSLAQDSGFRAYSSFASFVMISGLIWLIVQIKNNRTLAIGDVYYRGTAPLVRFILLAFACFLMSTPFLIGSLFYVQGLQATVPPSGPEKLLLGIIWAVLAVPSIWLVTRFFLAIYALIDKDLRPIEALRVSNSLVKSKTFKVLGRFITLLFFNILALAIPVFLMSFFKLSSITYTGLQLVLQLVSVVVLLPISNFYLYGLYQSLE